jgi:hypothetical protein
LPLSLSKAYGAAQLLDLLRETPLPDLLDQLPTAAGQSACGDNSSAGQFPHQRGSWTGSIFDPLSRFSDMHLHYLAHLKFVLSSVKKAGSGAGTPDASNSHYTIFQDFLHAVAY